MSARNPASILLLLCCSLFEGCRHTQVGTSQNDCSWDVPTIACVANTCCKDRTKVSGLERDVAKVCGYSNSPEVESREQWENFWSAVTPSARQPFLFFYVGHGETKTRNQERGELRSRDVGLPVAKRDWIYVGDLAREISAGSCAATLALNSCDSGYAPIHTANGTVVVIGAGYGDISAFTISTEKATPFAASFKDALDGEADLHPFGNCDTVITDREVQRFMSSRVRHEYEERVRWAHIPAVVLKRQTDSDVPLAWPDRPRCIQHPHPLKDGALQRFPAEFRAAAKQQLNIESTRRGPLPEWPKRILVLESADKSISELFQDAGTRNALRNYGYDVVDLTGVESTRIDALARSVWFTRIVKLSVETAKTGQRWLRLTEPAEQRVWMVRAVSMGVEADDPEGLLQEIIEALPKRLSVYRLAPNHVLLHVDGRVRGSIRIKYRSRDSDVWKEAGIFAPHGDDYEIVPCWEGRGQCFSLTVTGGGKWDEWTAEDVGGV